MSRPKQLKHVDMAAFEATPIEEMSLGAEESYALYLKDIKGLHQQECATLMGISRASFQQILDTAHRKVAQALLAGAKLKVEGGEFVTQLCQMTCQQCGHHYLPHLLKDKKTCPNCGSGSVSCAHKGVHCHRLGCPNAE